MNLNNKGFTLVEVLAVVVIMSILIAIMIPNVSNLITEQKQNATNEIKRSLKSAARIYISDNKYKIEVIGICPQNPTSTNKLNVKKTGEVENSKITVAKLIELGNLKEMKSGIKNPSDSKKILNEEQTKVTIHYSCQKKNLIVEEISDSELIWKNK